MKFVFLVLALFTLAACESDTGSKTCTMNGETVSCSTNNSGDEGGDPYSSPVRLRVETSSRIRFLEGKMEVVDYSQEKTSESANGGYYECAVETRPQVLNYQVKGKKLTLSVNGDKIVYTRLDGIEGPLGTWQNVEKDEEGTMTTVLEVGTEEIKIKVECFYE